MYERGMVNGNDDDDDESEDQYEFKERYCKMGLV